MNQTIKNFWANRRQNAWIVVEIALVAVLSFYFLDYFVVSFYDTHLCRPAGDFERDHLVVGQVGMSHEAASDSIGEASFANLYAPEHLIITTDNPWRIADRITAAGSVFVGPYTPESAGDYASGTNHTLPTSAWARSFSGVNLDSFYRKMTLQEITREGLKGLSDIIINMAQAEGLQAHANAVNVRTND